MKNKIITAGIAVAIALGTHTVAVPKAEAATVQSDTGKVVAYVTMRTGASTSNKAIRTMKPGELFQILAKVNAGYWFKIKDNTGKIGYVSTSSKYVKRISTAPTLTPTPTPPVEPTTTTADAIIDKGMNYLGTPYQFGAKSGQTNTFDCSSFMQFIFGSQGVKLPRDSRQQSGIGTEVSFADKQRGDLIFYDTNNDGRINHVGMYLGDGTMLHSNPSGGGVNVKSLSGFWENHVVVVKRVL